MNRNTVSRFIILVAVLACFRNPGSGQTFTVIDSLPEGAYGTAAWGDFDNDGFMDLIYLAQGFPVDFCHVYHNSGNVFTEVAQHFPVMYNPAARWADLNNDGFDDLVVNGMDSAFHNRTLIYKSNGDGSFTAVENSIFPLSSGSIDIADYNNDGWKDIAVTGFDSVAVNHAFIYKNLGGFIFSDIHAPLTGVHFGELKWGDYNNDSLPDLVINGIGDADYRTRVYRNMGNDQFELQSFYMQGSMGTVDWMDYDNDGFPDILVTGVDSTSGHNFTHLHHNNGDGTFSLVATNLPDFGEPSGAATADFNNDGFADICFTGGSSQFPSTASALAMGHGGTSFTVGPFFQGDILAPIVRAADIDNDGDPDLFFGHVILRNDLVTSSDGPGRPGKQVTVFPNPGGDDIIVKSVIPVIEVVLSDIEGKWVKSVQSEVPEKEVRLKGMANGIYIAMIRLSGNAVVVKKIVVIRN
jgi:hypothetical protein